MASTINRPKFHKDFLKSDIPDVKGFFEVLKQMSDCPLDVRGMSVKTMERQTKGRAEEKRLLKEEAVENTKQVIKEVSKEERTKFMKQTKQYYLANTKSILKLAKEHVDGKRVLHLKDLKLLNDEMRIILGIPNTISSNTHRVEDADEVDDFMSKLFGKDDAELDDIE